MALVGLLTFVTLELPTGAKNGGVYVGAGFDLNHLTLSSLEGLRFFDVVRQGRGAEVFGPLGFIEGKHEVFPVPQAQISLSNGLLTQNPGY